jgi:hypothetical protein
VNDEKNTLAMNKIEENEKELSIVKNRNEVIESDLMSMQEELTAGLESLRSHNEMVEKIGVLEETNKKVYLFIYACMFVGVYGCMYVCMCCFYIYICIYM